ncbi:Os07g0641800 [Oryza sativa Japonica Group]|jgi:uncharacterized protein YbaR (Trm112 family)|uniref:Os07g0641800 protein n=2 Tax=Oryza sativa subsp. japonica TaxID=39947 RepID=Q0D477_ORYSJ|nr:hypothetical protein EE612_040946 [Oryza sativa]BAF22346.1 Os07g0641800 [Oryza sativa Japonica Group]BAT02865.1 Os07g0641800 [Oryza sativa Japonica Group]|eukprot:NP_001060432.1 Os07g0641800 [Oryza sativa Japonica Group]
MKTLVAVVDVFLICCPSIKNTSLHILILMNFLACFSDQFMKKLKMVAEKKVGATKAELFCKTFEEAHKKLVYKELNLDAAQRFLNAYEKRS